MGLQDIVFVTFRCYGFLYLIFFNSFGYSFDQYFVQTLCLFNSSHFENCKNIKNNKIKDEISAQFKNYSRIFCNFTDSETKKHPCMFTMTKVKYCFLTHLGVLSAIPNYKTHICKLIYIL